MKKILFLITSLAMLVILAPLTVVAEESEEDIEMPILEIEDNEASDYPDAEERETQIEESQIESSLVEETVDVDFVEESPQQVGIDAATTSDLTAPVLVEGSLSVSTVSGKVGDTMTLRAQFTDEGSVESVIFSLKQPQSGNTYVDGDATFNDSTGYWELAIAITETTEIGTWTLWDIYAQDDSYNGVHYVNEVEEGSSSRWVEADLSAGVFYILNPSASGTCGDNLMWNLDSSGTLTIFGEGAMKDWYFLDMVPWYDYCSDITTVCIKLGVTTIGELAFAHFSNLTTIEIPTSVTYIGSEAFSHCCSITNIEIPSSIKYLDGLAFYGCSSLKSIEIPSNVTSIGVRTFYGCSSLTSIEIPSSVTKIGYFAFSECSSLASINIPSSVTSIDEYAFSKCTSLMSIEIPSGVKSIGNYVFSGCTSLTSVEIPSSVTSIGENAFNGCINLTNVEISSGVMSIGASAFYNCSSLTSIEIPTSVTNIGDAAFFGSGLTSIKIPSGVKSIGKSVFCDCRSLVSIEIPSTVTSIGAGAFGSCRSLVSIEIPSGVMSIGDGAFSGSGLTSVKIPAGVTNIGASTFDGCSNLASIEIPLSVTSIGESAFYNCSSLVSIEIPSSVTSIGPNAFYNCSSLASVEIPSGVKDIEDYTFYGCSGLTSMEIPSSVTSVGNGAFYGCSSITSIEIPPSVTSIGIYAFYHCSGLTSIEISAGVTSIGAYTFCGCYNLIIIEIPISVTSIENCAFNNTGLTSLIYTGSDDQWTAISIGPLNDALTSAFRYNPSVPRTGECGDGVTWSYYQNTLTISGEGAMDDYSIGATPWYKAGNIIDSVIVEEGCDYIGKNAFYGLNPVEGFTFTGGAPKTIKFNAFSGVTATCYYPNDDTSWTATKIQNYNGTLTWRPYTTAELVVLSVEQVPEKNYFLVGENFEATGLVLQAKYADGFTESVPLSYLTVGVCDMSTAGKKPVTVSYKGNSLNLDVWVHDVTEDSGNASDYPESTHNYAGNTDEIQTYTVPGATQLVAIFSSDCKTEPKADYVYIYDGNDNLVGSYNGSKFGGFTVKIPGDTMKVVLTSDDSTEYYGYSFESITATRVNHTLESIPGTAATCTESGLTDGVKCADCGEIITAQEIIPALGGTCEYNEYGVCVHCHDTKPDYVTGDTSGDGVLDGRDIVHLAKVLLGVVSDSTVNPDINGDGKVTLLDVIHLLRYLMGADVEICT